MMMTIAAIDNALQLICQGVCMILSIYHAFSSGKRIWILLSMYYSIYTLGILYWFLYMILYGETPYFSFISDFCWLAALLFLILMLMVMKDEEKDWKKHNGLLLVPVFTFGMALYYMTKGDYFTNIFYAVLMAFLIAYSIQGMMSIEKTRGRYGLCRAVFMLCVIEYCLWTSSCIDWEPYADYLYYFFDIMLTLVNVLLYLKAGKAAEDELY